ncbi:MAG TPA: NAD(P)-dependent oxidoreductase [Haloplasmataceae bacterium]
MFTIGFIGLGVMGAPMAERLLNRFGELYVFNRTKEKANKLIEKGAIWCDSPAELAKRCNLIFTIVGLPEDVQEVYLGKQGLVHHAEPGTILVDMTTSSPTLAKEISLQALERGVTVLDAPVSGGEIGAQKGILSIMVGGNREAFEKVLPVLEVLGQNIVFQGPSGSGQHAKIVNQIVIAGTMLGMIEGLVYAKTANLDLDAVLKSISKGAAASWQLEHNAPKVIAKDYQPGFYIKHFIKDMNIAQEEARKIALDLPGLDLVESMYNSLLENGYGNLGTQALIKYYMEDE